MRLKKETAQLCRMAFLCALALSLSALESVFTPILPPGAKAGISNVVTMYAAACLGLPSALVVVVVKAVFALVTRGVVAFLMSLVGGLFSAVLLFFLFRCARGKLGVIGISVLGAVTHNVAQGLFSLVIFGRAMLGYLPILIFLSLPSGVLTGSALFATLGILHRKERNEEHSKK